MYIIRLMSTWTFSSFTDTGIGRTGEAGISLTVITAHGVPSGPGGCLALCSAYSRGSAAFHPDMSEYPTVRSIRTGGPGRETAAGTGAMMREVKEESTQSTRGGIITVRENTTGKDTFGD
jgi:hypothetical protein